MTELSAPRLRQSRRRRGFIMPAMAVSCFAACAPIEACARCSSILAPYAFAAGPRTLFLRRSHHLATYQRAAFSGGDEFALGISVDLQSDESMYGRGDRHLSATLDEGDLVVYQTGTWTVDDVEVGDGTEPVRCLAIVDNLQVVWTHNCEHGVIRGLAVEVESSSQRSRRAILADPLDNVEFGPEQLVARIPVAWEDEGEEKSRGSILAAADVIDNLLSKK